MSERDELAAIIAERYHAAHQGVTVLDATIADAILAAGYRKPEVIVEWAAAHAANGAVHNVYRTQDEALAFVDSMAEVGHAMVVKSREYTPATYAEWTQP